MFNRRGVNKDLGLLLDAVRELQGSIVLLACIVGGLNERTVELEAALNDRGMLNHEESEPDVAREGIDSSTTARDLPPGFDPDDESYEETSV